jgi:G:T-mismatch repair DNA endonuclease (very short patch repair protein)
MIQSKWVSEGWQSMGDYLKYYNSLDTGPMVIGVQKLMESYFDEGIDIWKDCLSTPGVSRILLMKGAQEQNIVFPLIDEGDKDLHYLFRNQICAGPSLVFTRDLEVDKTQLSPGSDEVCKKILGYDCNSLYLAQMLHFTPSQNYVRRLHSENFKARFKRRYCLMYIWLEYMAKLEGVYIRTKQNQGYECKIGKYYVDGLSVKDGVVTVFEFLGCFYHAHQAANCNLNHRTGEEAKAIYHRTKQREDWLKSVGYRYVACWECDMMEILVANPDLKQKYKAMLPTFYNSHRSCVNEKQILKAVQSGQLFGFLVVDLHVPKEAQSKFDRFPPIFANHEVTLDDVGK